MRLSTILQWTTALRKAPCAACGCGCATAMWISVTAEAAATMSASSSITRSLFFEQDRQLSLCRPARSSVPSLRGREVIARQRPLLLPGRRWLGLAALLLAAACGQSGGPATPTPPAGEWHVFEGTWTAAGTRQTLRMGPNHRAAIFELTGSMLLTGAQRPALGFRAQAIGFSDSRTGMQGRCVWTDERGDMVYSELKGQAVGSGNHIVGTFVGGSGRYDGMTGDYTFQWQYVVDAEDGAVSGRVVDFKGRARFDRTAATRGEGLAG